VANLPYSVASTIFVELAQSPKRLERMVATLQLEVATGSCPGRRRRLRVLTLLLQLDYELRDWFKIPASCFFPARMWIGLRGFDSSRRTALPKASARLL